MDSSFKKTQKQKKDSFEELLTTSKRKPNIIDTDVKIVICKQSSQ